MAASQQSFSKYDISSDKFWETYIVSEMDVMSKFKICVYQKDANKNILISSETITITKVPKEQKFLCTSDTYRGSTREHYDLLAAVEEMIFYFKFYGKRVCQPYEIVFQ